MGLHNNSRFGYMPLGFEVYSRGARFEVETNCFEIAILFEGVRADIEANIPML